MLTKSKCSQVTLLPNIWFMSNIISKCRKTDNWLFIWVNWHLFIPLPPVHRVLQNIHRKVRVRVLWWLWRWTLECNEHRIVCTSVCAAFQISRQVKGHEGSVFCMCEMRSGTLLTGGGKDRKILLWDHELRTERDIEVKYTPAHTREE